MQLKFCIFYGNWYRVYENRRKISRVYGVKDVIEISIIFFIEICQNYLFQYIDEQISQKLMKCYRN